MKTVIILFLASIISLQSFSQTENGLYKGLERMCWTSNKGKVHCYDAPRKWYYENSLLIEKDTCFIYKVPVQIVGKKKMYSASDGGFYYYYGPLTQTDTGLIVSLTMHNCDYCATEKQVDSITGFAYPVPRVESYTFKNIPKGIKIGNVVYYKTTEKASFFPPKQMFYYDSNSVYRVDPKNQYPLIATGIKHFLQTKDLQLERDTLRISIDRVSDGKIVETLNAQNLKIDTSGIVFIFNTKKELTHLANTLHRPIRYLEIGEIIDYWQAARIYLNYTTVLPKGANLSQLELGHLFEYKKVGPTYLLVD